VKEFVAGQLVPFVGVVVAIVALTLALFDVPARAPESLPGMRVPVTAAPALQTASERARVDDTLSQVLRTLDDGRRARAASSSDSPFAARAPRAEARGPVTAPTPATPLSPEQPASPSQAPDPKLLSAVSALSDAVRAIHDARTEEDLLHAEELVRNARTQMETSCASSSGPLCASADQIRALGY
jgi:hypothetical protein